MQFGSLNLFPLQLRQLDEVTSQVRHLLSQVEHIYLLLSNLPSGHIHTAVTRSPLQEVHKLAFATHPKHLLSQVAHTG